MGGAIQQGLIVANLLESRNVCVCVLHIVICFVVKQAFSLKVTTLRKSFAVLKKDKQNNSKQKNPLKQTQTNKQKPQQHKKANTKKLAEGKS